MRVLDAVSALDKLNLTAELLSKVKLLSSGAGILERMDASKRAAAILRELGAGVPAAQAAAQSADTDFPLKEASSSYSGISHSGNARAKSDAEDYEKTILQAVEEARPLAETDAQRAALVSEEAAFRAEYLAKYRVLMGVRSGTYSGHIAGRSGLNSKQASSRNSALDNAMDRFYGWVKNQGGRIKTAVLAARNPEQLAAAKALSDAAQAEKDAKAAQTAQKNVDFMVKLLAFKAGDKLPSGSATITKVNKTRDGVPSTLTFVMPDGSKPYDDKIDVLRVFYRGDKARLAADFEAAKAMLEQEQEEQRPARVKLTTQRLHSVIQAALQVKSSLYSPSQRIDRATYDVNTSMKGVYGVFSTKHLADIVLALEAAGISFDKSDMDRGFLKVPVWQDSITPDVAVEPEPATVADPDPAEAVEAVAQPAYEIVEHVTKGGRGKTIRGIIRTDLSYAEAKAIDEYTFKKDGGWFIREKHLEGFTPKEPGARPEPVVKPELTPEQQAQAEADRLADEQLKDQEKRQSVADKLRDAGQATIDKAEQELGADRQTNTARRAAMASSITARHEQARAIGKTMQNLAQAIESGEATHLAGITSRAAVETLHERLVQGMYEHDRSQKLSYSDQERQKGRPATEADAKHASMPQTSWNSAGASAAKILEAIKGKRGAPALADKIRYTVGPDAEALRALKAMLGPKEFSYQVGWWNVEQVAKVERLRRAGITNNEELRAALGEYLQYREGARAEDPIKKAERAIIGQKVGIDFFPTPAATASRMAELARIGKGDRVLEPSAGNGNLADAARAKGAEVDVLEISSQLRDILKAKGYNVVDHDFESFSPSDKYDAVIMNPPFSSRKDAEHIQRAYTMLKPGGRLVAIAGEGVFIGSDAKAVQFRDWLDAKGADVESLEQNTFKDKNLLATTGANGRLIVITK